MEKKRFLEGDNKRFCVVSRLLCFFCLFIGIYACQVDEDGVVNKGTLAFRMNVDTALVDGVVAAALPHLPAAVPVLVLPTQQVGLSPEHEAFAGTLTLSPATVIALWTELGACVARAGVRKLLLFNSHGGQVSVMDIVARELRARHGLLVYSASWYSLPQPDAVQALFPPEEHRFGIHAGDVETSMMLALRPELPLHVQQRSMDEAARAEYLHRFETPNTVFLALCVLGGIFSEGIDLPGARLIGTAIVGVGLPQVNPAQEALRACYDAAFADGFGMAYRYPGMHRVLQAVGRVIRSETDCGVALLLDDRYADPRWQALMPPHYHPQLVRSEDEIRARSQDFWRTHGI